MNCASDYRYLPEPRHYSWLGNEPKYAGVLELDFNPHEAGIYNPNPEFRTKSIIPPPIASPRNNYYY